MFPSQVRCNFSACSGVSSQLDIPRKTSMEGVQEATWSDAVPPQLAPFDAKGRDEDWLVNEKVCPLAQLPLCHNGPVQHLHYRWQCTNPPVDLNKISLGAVSRSVPVQREQSTFFWPQSWRCWLKSQPLHTDLVTLVTLWTFWSLSSVQVLILSGATLVEESLQWTQNSRVIVYPPTHINRLHLDPLISFKRKELVLQHWTDTWDALTVFDVVYLFQDRHCRGHSLRVALDKSIH